MRVPWDAYISYIVTMSRVNKCATCRISMHPNDSHASCLKCLTGAHAVEECAVCQDLPEVILATRLDIVARALANGQWPGNWPSTLDNIEQNVWTLEDSNVVEGLPQCGVNTNTSRAPATVSSAKPDAGNTQSKLIGKTNHKSQSVTNTQHVNTDTLNSKGAGGAGQGKNGASGSGQGEGRPIQRPIQDPSLESLGGSQLFFTELDKWKTGIESSVSAVGDTLKEFILSERQHREHDKKKSKRSKSSRSGSKSKSREPRAPQSDRQGQTNIQGQSNDQPSAGGDTVQPIVSGSGIQPVRPIILRPLGTSSPDHHNLSLGFLDEVQVQPPPFKIPRHGHDQTQSSFDDSRVSQVVSTIQGSDSEVDSDKEVDLGRGDRRKMYLAGLRNIVPELKHSKIDSAPQSGHFSLLVPKPKDNIMPMLGQVFQNVSAVAGFSKKKKDPFKTCKRVSEFYVTTEPAESSLLQPRSVPRQLTQFVPNNSIFEGGASAKTIRLQRNTFNGNTESHALRSHAQASTFIRVSNNIEIGVEVTGNLLNQIGEQLQRLRSRDLPAGLSTPLAIINSKMAMLKQTNFDIKSSNNDIMKVALSQYQGALESRREAWFDEANLPTGIRNELRKSEYVVPKETDTQAKVISMLSPQAVLTLEEHQQYVRDKALLDLSSRGRGRGAYRGRGGNRGGRGRGRFQGNRPQHSNRGFYRGGFKGGYRGGFKGKRSAGKQPFSPNPNQNKKE